MMVNLTVISSFLNRKRGSWAWGEDGEWQAQESQEASNHLLQLPAGRSAEEVSEHSIPRAARESWARSFIGTHANTGGKIEHSIYLFSHHICSFFGLVFVMLKQCTSLLAILSSLIK